MKSAPRRVITKTNIHSESYRLTEKTIMSLKLGVIGAGAIGKEHIRRCTQVLQGATVVAVSDINADNARAAVALPGVQAEVYADGHDVINASDVDAILVTSYKACSCAGILFDLCLCCEVIDCNSCTYECTKEKCCSCC